jgi:hypothetical protein
MQGVPQGAPFMFMGLEVTAFPELHTPSLRATLFIEGTSDPRW